MTTEDKALALVNEVARERGSSHDSVLLDRAFVENEALCRAIEQHEAFRQEVSDAVEDTKLMVETHCDTEALALVSNRLNRFIIPKPKHDPLVEALDSLGLRKADEWAGDIRKALAARGLEIREKGQ